jgi:hypothetical protein
MPDTASTSAAAGGQLGAAGRLSRPQPRAFAGRLGNPLVRHRGRLRDEPLLADDAIVRLHRVSTGLPRALNNAAVAALIAVAAAGKDLVDDACAKKAFAKLTRD